MTKKGKGKKATETPENHNSEVIIYIGLSEWSPKGDCLKKKHGKRLALRANKKDPPSTLLQKALTKWKVYKSDCYCEDKSISYCWRISKKHFFFLAHIKSFLLLNDTNKGLERTSRE